MHTGARLARRARARWKILTATSLLTALAAVFAATALAGGSGDFSGCVDVLLNPGQLCHGPNSHTWVETEGWNTNDAGYANCNGVESGGSPLAYACDTNLSGTGYDSVYCTSSCNTVTGYGFVSNASGVVNTWYTGWGDYSS